MAEVPAAAYKLPPRPSPPFAPDPPVPPTANSLSELFPTLSFHLLNELLKIFARAHWRKASVALSVNTPSGASTRSLARPVAQSQTPICQSPVKAARCRLSGENAVLAGM